MLNNFFLKYPSWGALFLILTKKRKKMQVKTKKKTKKIFITMKFDNAIVISY